VGAFFGWLRALAVASCCCATGTESPGYPWISICCWRVLGGLIALGLASCRCAIGTGEIELTSFLSRLPPLWGFMPMNPHCGC